MSITVVGSLAFDAVRTPFGERERMLGGAATYFALAASFFDQVHVVGRVGEDFGDEDLGVVALRDTDVANVERVPLPDRCADVVTALEILEHAAEPEQVARGDPTDARIPYHFGTVRAR